MVKKQCDPIQCQYCYRNLNGIKEDARRFHISECERNYNDNCK